MSSISEVVGALQEADSVCIVAHLRPDADALGSMGTLRLGLEQLGKKDSLRNWPRLAHFGESLYHSRY